MPTPSDLELRSAYCLAVNRNFVQTFEVTEEMRDKAQILHSNVERLEAYLNEKANSRPLKSSLATATLRAEVNLEASVKEISYCVQSCEINS